MPTENPYLDGTGSFVSTATNAGTVKFASFDDSAVNTGVIAVSATFAGTAVNSGIIGDVFPTQYATFLANNSANWDSAYNTVSDLSAEWMAGGGGSGGTADLTAISDVSSSWDSAFTFVSLNSSSLVDTNDSRLSDERTPVAHTHGISDVTGLQTALDGKQASGDYVTLVDGKVPSNQLPSYVDDVIEEASSNDFPATGEIGKIYVAIDINKTYRWSGSTYVEISPSPGSTDSVTEGSTNLYFTNTRAVNALQSTVNTLSTAIDGKQASGSYATASHTHIIGDVTGLQTALDSKQASGSYATTTITTALSTAIDSKAATSHTHAISSVTGLQTAIDAKAATSHTHAISAVTGLQAALDAKAATSHTHTISNVTGLQTALDGKQASGSYAASSHTHAISDVTGLQTALDGKQASGSYAASSHTHTASQITDFNTAANTALQSTVNSLSAAINSVPAATTVKTIASTTYTLLSSDANNVLRYNSASNTTITIPQNIMSVGSQIILVQINTGSIITSAAAGVTRYAPSSATKTTGIYSVASLLQTAQNEWLLTGDIN